MANFYFVLIHFLHYFISVNVIIISDPFEEVDGDVVAYLPGWHWTKAVFLGHLFSSVPVGSMVMSHPEVRKHPEETGLSLSVSLRGG